MKIDIKETLDFFDGKHSHDSGHASGVVGIIGEDLNANAFKHYMERKGARVEILNTPVTTGKVKGKRLDRWIYVKEGNEKEVLYQTEIKNWSSWAIGGTPLPINANSEEILKATRHYWKRQKDVDFVKGSHPNGVTKVLVPMILPKEYESVAVEPLLIYWMPLSNTGHITPLFSVPVAEAVPQMKTPFKTLYIFSVSLYFRELLNRGETHVEFDMPHVDGRMKILKRIIVS